jgi:hypothetical protein
MKCDHNNTFKNSLGNWWWLNSQPEASLPG